jgi:YggT family protein
MLELPTVVRYVVFSLFVLSVLVALASWLVRTRRLSPFGALGRALRAASEPVIRPVERRLVRLGGNPVHAGWWLVVVVAAGGVLLLSLLDWIINTVAVVVGSVARGPRGVILVLIPLVYWVLVAALMLRVIASWFGFFRYARWMRPAYALTDWLVEPIRRVLPALGPLDWSPLAAWLVFWVLERMLLAFVAAL